eukprot:TRINITY_DN10508_c0_g1_i2.p1 TRINITY_DN10508_c0_g1~~TRINITY_DN10508_c0_g1_i2.p1  ORF type:complete len:355 (-),score=79.25 TRINITY_DN10508_c0_g1_i2:25-1089(-)
MQPGVASTSSRKARSSRHRLQAVAELLSAVPTDFEDLERTDPGRAATRSEWAGPAEIAFEEHSEYNGLVRVYRAEASESGGSWRRLCFNDSTEQSVVLLGADGRPLRDTMAFGTLKTLSAVSVCTSSAVGKDTSKLRVLCMGVGGGTLPGWYAEQLNATVDAVELDPVVVKAANVAMGLPTEALRDVGDASACAADAVRSDRGKLHVYTCNALEYVDAAAKAGLKYDIAILDVFDGAGDTPQAFFGIEFATALGSIADMAAANLTCPVPMWEEAHEFNSPDVAALAKSWRAGFGENAGVWSVRCVAGQNVCPAVCNVGIPPSKYLEQEAREAAEKGVYSFDPLRRVALGRREWY